MPEGFVGSTITRVGVGSEGAVDGDVALAVGAALEETEETAVAVEAALEDATGAAVAVEEGVGSAEVAPSGDGAFTSGAAGLHAAKALERRAIHDTATGFAQGIVRWYAPRGIAAMGLVEGRESWSHRAMRSACSLLPICSSALLALGAITITGCSRFKGSGDDVKPAPPAVTTPAAPAAPTLALGEHTVNVQCEDSPGLVLYRVTVEETSTKLDFTFTNNGKRATRVTVSPPGDKYAMFLEWEPGKKARFQSATGISVKPKESQVPAGQSLSFSLVFGPLEPGVRTFDMYEGEDAKKVMPGQSTYWVMRKIELK